MNREQFVGYLAARAKDLEIPLYRAGKLLGLPREFHHALALAHLLDALGRPSPSSEVLRTWYGQAASANAEAARWVYRVVGSLRDPDLKKLGSDELMSFWMRLGTWGATANSLARDANRKRKRKRKAH